MHVRLRERGHLSDQRLSSGVLGVAEAGSDYFSSDKHYASLARRIAAALRCGSGWALIIGDPPANPQALSEAVGNVAGVRYEVIIISCGPELTRGDLERTVPVIGAPRATAGAAVTSELSVAASPLFVFDDFDRLSDKQIEELCKDTLHCGEIPAAGILLASLDFVARLERPALHFLKDRLAAHFRVQEVGDDEAITFLHNQLIAQRDRRIEARGFRHGVRIGLATSGVVLAAGIGLFIILNPTAEHIRGAPESTQERRTVSEAVSMLSPAEERLTDFDAAYAVPKTGTTSPFAHTPPQPLSSTEAESPLPVAQPARTNPPAQERITNFKHSVPKTETTSPFAPTPPQPLSSTVVESPLPVAQSTRTHPPAEEPVTNFESAHAAPKSKTSSAFATTPPPLLSPTVVESPAPVALSVMAHPPADLHYSDAEIAALVRRGDAFLTSGDITSARLFYERAADAGSGPAALQLGATFDPVVLGRVGARGVIADPAQALSWYRRARDLGMVEAEQRIKRFETQSPGEQDTRSR
jgi:hypothetical protein